MFALRAAPTAPITVEVRGVDGAVISRNDVQGGAGMNQTPWNLAYPPAQPVLRSMPPDNPYLWEAGRWPVRERPVTHWALGAQRWQPRVAPGKYTVRMTYNNRQYSQQFDVVRDVTLASTDADLVAKHRDAAQHVVGAINDVVDRINRIEIMRAQVEDLRRQHGSDRALDQASPTFTRSCTRPSCTSRRARRCTSGTSKNTGCT